jgi:tRNA(Ile)-lysidine synthase
VSPGRKDITSKHVKALGELAEKSGSKKLDLPGNLQAVKEYNLLRLKVSGDGNQDSLDKNREHAQLLLDEEGSYELKDGSVLEVSYISPEQIDGIVENKYTKYFDYDRISSYLKVRFRQPGDYLCINDSLQKKTLKEYFIQEKVPVNMRSEIPVIADANHVLWILGYRISAYYKVTKETKKIVKITLRRNEKWQKE